jgi:thioredoxin 1
LENEEDKELERIKRAKLKKIMKKRVASKKEEVILNKPVEVTDATFKETIENHSLVMVDCWAPWCGPCHIVAPVVKELARDYAGKILVGKLNVDENPATAMQYQIMSIPTLLVFSNGKLVDRIIGAMPKQILELKITRHLYFTLKKERQEQKWMRNG